jgi:arsenate reductase (glutaredoxin)
VPVSQLYFNPSCSKCRSALSLLDGRGMQVEVVRYLDRAPTRDDLVLLMEQLGIEDPRLMMRTAEPVYAEVGLGDESSHDDLLTAITTHPILLERPIFVVDGRAVIGRPPERVLEIL